MKYKEETLNDLNIIKDLIERINNLNKIKSKKNKLYKAKELLELLTFVNTLSAFGFEDVKIKLLNTISAITMLSLASFSSKKLCDLEENEVDYFNNIGKSKNAPTQEKIDILSKKLEEKFIDSLLDEANHNKNSSVIGFSSCIFLTLSNINSSYDSNIFSNIALLATIAGTGIFGYKAYNYTNETNILKKDIEKTRKP